jgi:hypothetical protein
LRFELSPVIRIHLTQIVNDKIKHNVNDGIIEREKLFVNPYGTIFPHRVIFDAGYGTRQSESQISCLAIAGAIP